MTVVADSSPLIILAKLNCFDLLQKPYSSLFISPEVYSEVVVAGAGLPGAAQVTTATWVEARSIHDPAEFSLSISVGLSLHSPTTLEVELDRFQVPEYLLELFPTKRRGCPSGNKILVILPDRTQHSAKQQLKCLATGHWLVAPGETHNPTTDAGASSLCVPFSLRES